MKKFFLALLIPSSLSSITIPKSSLETVKSDVITKLENAQKQKDPILIKKYQDELNQLAEKIKHFELEWLQYRKRQLSLKPSNPAIKTELEEINVMIKVRS